MNRRLLGYNKEQLIEHVILNDIKKEDIIKYVESNLIDEKEKEALLVKIDEAYTRINIPLDLDSKILFLLFPFGIVSAFTDSHTDEIERYREYGNVQKIKDYRRYSLFGILMYVTLPLLIKLLFFNT